MSIADKLTYLQTTKQLLKTEINKINNVLTDNSTFRSYPQELFNGYLDILNNGTDTLWNNLEKVSQTGTEAVLENVETAPMKMVLNGNTSQDGTPTPDTPVEVKVVKGENVVSVSGKNLFDETQISRFGRYNAREVINDDKSMTITSTGSNGYVVIAPVQQYENGKTYTISFDVDDISKFSRVRMFIDTSTPKYSTSHTNIITFTANEDEHLCFGIYPFENETITISNIQIEENSTATPYVPYSKTDYPINLGDIELCKINTYKDYFHKDSGKWYVHKAIGKVVLDGSETYGITTLSQGMYRFVTTITDLNSIPYEYGNTDGYSNYFNYLMNYSGKLDVQKTYIAINNVYFITSVASTPEDFKTWLSTHNTIIYYPLATPTEEEITNTTLIEQLEAIANAKSVKDKTYITQTNDELPFILDVQAIKEYEVV